MTVFNDTFDKATPAGSDDPAEADNRMQEIKAAVQERENVDHYWPLTGTEVSDVDTGEHRKVTLRVGSAPSAVANKGFVYAKDVAGKAELFYRDEDGNEIQITSAGTLLVDILADGAILAAATESGDPDRTVADKKYVDDEIVGVADSTYSGGESHTFGGGLIFKQGTKAYVTSTIQTVNFAAAFPNGVVSGSITVLSAPGSLFVPVLSALSQSSISWKTSSGAATEVHWQAWGH